ncbi:ABC transporter ATP-binding protein [Arthrobacter sp. S41]|uniref:ABC transporter ATP-binding protein n=1 Tax=Micrococcaceae TaxID=1268 RepID=UPI0010355EC2|nr:ABC transporter ATP-binding protein [Arthrobacter sp. S41]TAP25088.1 ABC transporter ATP-binding protein [Arthrobacter sp. S41]
MQTGQSTKIVLEARELIIGYQQRVICGPLDLQVSAGDGVGIIGANGSGKSTLVRTILGHLSPVQGTVEFLGLPVNEDSLAFRQHVAVQITDGAFFEELTVAEHLELVARGHNLNSWKQSVSEELEFFELQQVAGLLPSELSSGQRRKVLLAATLIRPAQLMILDEPEQRLDLRIRQKLYDRLAVLRGSGTTLLVVTHDPQMLRHCLNHAFLLNEDQGEALHSEAGAQWLER